MYYPRTIVQVVSWLSLVFGEIGPVQGVWDVAGRTVNAVVSDGKKFVLKGFRGADQGKRRGSCWRKAISRCADDWSSPRLLIGVVGIRWEHQRRTRSDLFINEDEQGTE